MSVWSPKTLWPLAPACYHEPRVHDHSLYFYLRKLNVYLLLPIAVMGIVFNASALAFLYRPPRITSGVSVYLKALLIMDHAQLFTTVATVFMPQICDLHHSGNHTLYGFCMFQRRFLKHVMPRIEATVNTIHVWTIAALSAHRYWKVNPLQSYQCFHSNQPSTGLIYIYKYVYTYMHICRFFQILSPYRFIYHSIFDPLLDNILPFIWMSLFSLMTLSEIYRSRHLEYQKFGNLFSKETRLNHLTKRLFRKTYLIRQRQELRATVSIVSIIVLYLLLHTLRLCLIARKWQLLIKRQCPTRSDYFHSYVAYLFSMMSASVNAFVFIGFTSRVRNCVQVIIRRTSQKLLSSTETPLPARSTQESDQLQKE
ncbi:hypothetical protein Angca_001566 [Angiostrongylus cantonensis]|nr:hypothetical protein Angca_001566 [Angiostrongylus cantonensis]